MRLFAIGLGQTTPPAETNRIGQPGQKVAGNVVVGMDNAGVEVVEAKLVENLIGIYEVRFKIPETAAPGDHILAMGVVPASSNTYYNAQDEGAVIPVGPAR